jgi:hypothetical protein
MKKLLLTLILSGMIISAGFAQAPDTSAQKGGVKINIGAEGGLPLDEVSTAGYSSVLGGSLKVEIPTIKNAYFTLSAGYNSFLLKSKYKGYGISSTANFIPLKAGAKYYTDAGFFIEGQAGVVFSTETNGGHAFVFSPGAGYTFAGGFEAGLRYEGWSNGGTTSQLSLRLGFRF